MEWPDCVHILCLKLHMYVRMAFFYKSEGKKCELELLPFIATAEEKCPKMKLIIVKSHKHKKMCTLILPRCCDSLPPNTFIRLPGEIPSIVDFIIASGQMILPVSTQLSTISPHRVHSYRLHRLESILSGCLSCSNVLIKANNSHNVSQELNICLFCTDKSWRDGCSHCQGAVGANETQSSGWRHHVHGEGHGSAGGSPGRAAEEPHARRQGQRSTEPQ